jgi:hypothetical protein
VLGGGMVVPDWLPVPPGACWDTVRALQKASNDHENENENGQAPAAAPSEGLTAGVWRKQDATIAALAQAQAQLPPDPDTATAAAAAAAAGAGATAEAEEAAMEAQAVLVRAQGYRAAVAAMRGRVAVRKPGGPKVKPAVTVTVTVVTEVGSRCVYGRWQIDCHDLWMRMRM